MFIVTIALIVALRMRMALVVAGLIIVGRIARLGRLASAISGRRLGIVLPACRRSAKAALLRLAIAWLPESLPILCRLTEALIALALLSKTLIAITLLPRSLAAKRRLSVAGGRLRLTKCCAGGRSPAAIQSRILLHVLFHPLVILTNFIYPLQQLLQFASIEPYALAFRTQVNFDSVLHNRFHPHIVTNWTFHILSLLH